MHPHVRRRLAAPGGAGPRRLLAALARTGAPAADGELELAGRFAQAAPGATDALTAWLERLAFAELVEAGEGGAR